MDPHAVLALTESTEVAAVADEARERLLRVRDALAARQAA
jgi:hypothetical protein